MECRGFWGIWPSIWVDCLITCGGVARRGNRSAGAELACCKKESLVSAVAARCARIGRYGHENGISCYGRRARGSGIDVERSIIRRCQECRRTRSLAKLTSCCTHASGNASPASAVTEIRRRFGWNASSLAAVLRGRRKLSGRLKSDLGGLSKSRWFQPSPLASLGGRRAREWNLVLRAKGGSREQGSSHHKCV